MNQVNCNSFDIMYTILPGDSGINGVKMFFADENVVGGLHGPRLNVSNKLNRFDIYDYYAVSVAENPVVEYGVPTLPIEIQQQVIECVKMNRCVLLDLWDDTCDDPIDFYLNLERIDGVITDTKREIMESRKQHNG